jgi:hypothetical protein
MLTFKQYLSEILKPGIELHDVLNPKIWDNDNEIKDDIRTRLLDIADKFIEFLEINTSYVSDIILTGSNTSYTYTEYSDLDLHIVFKKDLVCDNCSGDFVKDCFWAKKTVWNDNHDITIKGYDVELYAQPEDDDLVAIGIFSLKNNKWIKQPGQTDNHIDSDNVKLKTEEFINQINDLIDNETDDEDNLMKLKDKLKLYRKSGLAKHGEFGVENLVFKTLRNNGMIEKLNNYITKLQDKNLSY